MVSSRVPGPASTLFCAAVAVAVAVAVRLILSGLVVYIALTDTPAADSGHKENIGKYGTRIIVFRY